MVKVVGLIAFAIVVAIIAFGFFAFQFFLPKPELEVRLWGMKYLETNKTVCPTGKSVSLAYVAELTLNGKAVKNATLSIKTLRQDGVPAATGSPIPFTFNGTMWLASIHYTCMLPGTYYGKAQANFSINGKPVSISAQTEKFEVR